MLKFISFPCDQMNFRIVITLKRNLKTEVIICYNYHQKVVTGMLVVRLTERC